MVSNTINTINSIYPKVALDSVVSMVSMTLCLQSLCPCVKATKKPLGEFSKGLCYFVFKLFSKS